MRTEEASGRLRRARAACDTQSVVKTSQRIELWKIAEKCQKDAGLPNSQYRGVALVADYESEIRILCSVGPTEFPL